jgi:glutamyl-tRNA reductase
MTRLSRRRAPVEPITPDAQQAMVQGVATWQNGRLLVVGTSHHVAPVMLREQLLGKSAERAAEALTAVVRERIGPNVVLSTCNRIEVYCWTTKRRAASSLVRLLAGWSGLADADLSPHLYVRTGAGAAHHLVRVAAGLDSLAVGESQVLGQVRAAWQLARSVGPLGAPLDTLFQRVIEAARRMRRAGAFDRHPSVARIAVERAGGVLGGLEGRRAAVLGAGVTGQEALRALLNAGVAHATLLNRSRRRLVETGSAFPPARVSAATLEALPRILAEVDVLVCATASPEPVVSAASIAAALSARAGRPLVLVDIAIPRDVEPASRALAGVRLLDLDDLASHCVADAPARRAAMERADTQAHEAAQAFMAELRVRAAAPEIAALRAHAETIRTAELRRAQKHLAGLTPREQAAIEHLTRTILQKLVHSPTVALRRAAAAPATATSRRARQTILDAFSRS